MPIRINLLAEEQAAEEMRRRDPVKRAIFLGAALLVLMLGWIAVTQMTVAAKRSELAQSESRLKKVDEASRQVRSNQVALADAETKLRSLERYATNRFLWGTFLDQIQQTAVENVRIVEIRADQRYGAGDVNKFFTTNLNIKYTPPAPYWKFWAQGKASQPVLTLVSNSFSTFTNKPPFTTNLLDYTVKVALVSTNASEKQVVARADFSTVPWASERIVVEIRGRDYGTPPGAAIDELARRINSSPYFKHLLEPEEGFRFTERPPQPRPDPQDPVNPNALFVPFTIELTFKERTLTSE
jgi:hypothetical protein